MHTILKSFFSQDIKLGDPKTIGWRKTKPMGSFKYSPNRGLYFQGSSSWWGNRKKEEIKEPYVDA